MDPSTRWQQRHASFERALSLLQEPLRADPASLSMLEKEGVVHRFEYTFDLGWKAIKDYLQFQGIDLKPIAPRQVLKQAIIAEIIEDGQTWIDMLEDRVRASHQSNDESLTAVVSTIRDTYLPAMEAVHGWLNHQITE